MGENKLSLKVVENSISMWNIMDKVSSPEIPCSSDKDTGLGGSDHEAASGLTSVSTPGSKPTRQGGRRAAKTGGCSPGDEADLVDVIDGGASATTAHLHYEWPVGSGEYFFIEEYLSHFLSFKSVRAFRRQYPLVKRRPLSDLEERDFLIDSGIVTGNLGVKIIAEDEVYQRIVPSHKEKFAALHSANCLKTYYGRVKGIREQERKQKCLSLEELREASLRACADWNKDFRNKATSKFYDSQTGILQTRQNADRNASDVRSRVGARPVALFPGQFVDHVPRYTSEQLKCLPLNTVLESLPSRF